jgi:hypothetical protein
MTTSLGAATYIGPYGHTCEVAGCAADSTHSVAFRPRQPGGEWYVCAAHVARALVERPRRVGGPGRIA